MKNSPRLLVFLAILVLLLIGVPAGAQDNATPPPGYRDLPDISLFRDEALGQWAGSGGGTNLETANSFGNPGLPIDQSVQNNGLPSYRINVTGENGWWAVILAGTSWESYSLEPYYPDGFLEFNIRSDGNPVNFAFYFSDVDRSRTPGNLETDRLNITDFVQTTTEWQAVRVPLQLLFGANTSLNLRQMQGLHLTNVDGAPLQFWLNDIRITSDGLEPAHAPVKLNQVGYAPNASS